jgi:hypothetical protein
MHKMRLLFGLELTNNNLKTLLKDDTHTCLLLCYSHPIRQLHSLTSSTAGLQVFTMNPAVALLRSQRLTFFPCKLSGCFHTARRTYATQRAADVLSSSLDTKQRGNPRVHDSVGPFQLGVSQAALRNGERVKKWSELSTKGKGELHSARFVLSLNLFLTVARTATRTSNLTVILLGAGLSALLVYSLTSELFSKNSPTVLYGDACDRIKASPKVSEFAVLPSNSRYQFSQGRKILELSSLIS